MVEPHCGMANPLRLHQCEPSFDLQSMKLKSDDLY
jgi:hypothetical protein